MRIVPTPLHGTVIARAARAYTRGERPVQAVIEVIARDVPDEATQHAARLAGPAAERLLVSGEAPVPDAFRKLCAARGYGRASGQREPAPARGVLVDITLG